MSKEMCFEFSSKGFEEMKQYNEFKDLEDFIKDIKNTPKIVPIALVGLLAITGIYTFGGTVVAYKAIEDVSLVAFKYISVGGGL